MPWAAWSATASTRVDSNNAGDENDGYYGFVEEYLYTSDEEAPVEEPPPQQAPQEDVAADEDDPFPRALGRGRFHHIAWKPRGRGTCCAGRAGGAGRIAQPLARQVVLRRQRLLRDDRAPLLVAAFWVAVVGADVDHERARRGADTAGAYPHGSLGNS